MEDHRKDRWKREAACLVVLGENFCHVAERPQWHGWIWSALMLEKEIEKDFPGVDADGK